MLGTLLFNQILHRAIAGECQAVFLPVKAVNQIKENLSLEVGRLK